MAKKYPRLTDEQREMVEKNLPFVTYVAKKYFSKTDYIKNQDILQEGVEAMIKAVPKYDPTKGKITTYLFPTIDGHLKRFSRYQDRIIPIPHQKHLKPETMAKAENAKNLLSLDYEYSSPNEESDYTLKSIIPDENTPDADNIINDISIRKAIESLEWREKIVIIYRFLLDLNQTHIGKLMGLSQVHVHRIEKKGLANMKKSMT